MARLQGPLTRFTEPFDYVRRKQGDSDVQLGICTFTLITCLGVLRVLFFSFHTRIRLRVQVKSFFFPFLYMQVHSKKINLPDLAPISQSRFLFITGTNKLLKCALFLNKILDPKNGTFMQSFSKRELVLCSKFFFFFKVAHLLLQHTVCYPLPF